MSGSQREPLWCSQIAGGDGHSLVVADSGDLFAFGDGSDGQLGNGEYEAVLRVAKLQNQNDSGQDVGNGIDGGFGDVASSFMPPVDHLDYTPRSSGKPIPVQISARIVHVSCGARNSACLDSVGNVYTWGFDGDTRFLADQTNYARRMPNQASQKTTHAEYYVTRLAHGPPSIFCAKDLAQMKVSESDWKKATSSLPRVVLFPGTHKPIIKNLSCTLSFKHHLFYIA